MLPELARIVRRIIVRIQPYVPDVLGDVLQTLPRYAAAGVHGVTIEGMKWNRGPLHGRPHSRRLAFPPTDGVKVAGDWCYPLQILDPHFLRIRDRCHQLQLRFYAAENRLRRLSDDLCCCAVDRLPGFRPNNDANLSAPAFDRPLRFRPAMRRFGTPTAFKSLGQSPVCTVAVKRLSYADCIRIVAPVPAYQSAMGLERGPQDGPRSPALPDHSPPRRTRPETEDRHWRRRSTLRPTRRPRFAPAARGCARSRSRPITIGQASPLP